MDRPRSVQGLPQLHILAALSLIPDSEASTRQSMQMPFQIQNAGKKLPQDKYVRADSSDETELQTKGHQPIWNAAGRAATALRTERKA